MPTRTIFFHISVFQQACFYTLALISTGIALIPIVRHARIWLRGGLPFALQQALQHLASFSREVFAHRHVLRRRYAGIAHLLLFYGMLVLFIGTCIVAIEHYGAFFFGPHWLYYGGFYLTCKITLDIFGLALVIGILLTLLRRLCFRPEMLGHTPWDTGFLLLLLAATFTGFLLEGAGLAADPSRHAYMAYSPIGRWFALLFPHLSPTGYVLIWWVHAPLVLTTIAALPYGRRLHLFTAPLSILLQPNRNMGVLESETMEKVEQTGHIGLRTLADLNGTYLLNLDACMECGRCTEACPAHAVGKPLDPKQIVLSLRQQMWAADLLETTTDVIDEESLWACTNCHACVQECPAAIRHVDLINGIRRYRVGEGHLSGSAGTMLRQLASQKNPWGLSASQRMEWAKGLDVPIVEPGQKPDILLWVGCAGAFEPRAQATMRALVSLLHTANVSFAVLGHQECCTGDPARRMGEEFLFQELAAENIAVLNRTGASSILTACPHCFHTLKHEYPQFGGNYQVMHHTQFLKQLVQNGRLQLERGAQTNVTYHDPCFLARVNGEVRAPRALLQTLTHQPLKEPEHYADRTLCCGAGGGRMWMEEPSTQRPSNRRVKELLSTGAQTIAVSCPFCKVMLGDSLATSEQNTAHLADIAEILLASIAKTDLSLPQ
ncbi:Fe-S oxidoreductase [Chthonomonas calidirosea]|uniref:heterodisulfide reductase-related iron-sulfur binding cluster n=1 Tax=Chthonomonas calidirosea TaxID=454171 RepID=UPI0006DD50F0|nr:(Fe-S)-binding protein [Chthonomonas calidirosea]CEK13653.1 Fe-S oxidoreductase [Chthonomonas calidirosea]